MRTNVSRAARFFALILAAFILLGAVPGQAALKKIDLSNLKKPAKETPASKYSFIKDLKPSLSLNSTGEDVTKLQNRLYDLGYLKAKADGEYGYLTERAVRLFQLNNGLEESDIAYSSTFDKLYGICMPYTENLGKSNDLPPLVMAGRLEWKGRKNGKVSMRVKVMNVEQERTVDNFTIRCWFEDAYGEEVACGQIEWDNRKKVKPGKVAFSDYCAIPNASSIYTCHFAISRIHMTNGDVFYPTDDEPTYMDFIYDP